MNDASMTLVALPVLVRKLRNLARKIRGTRFHHI